MVTKNFSGRAASVVGPATALRSVKPDDAVDLPGGVCRGLFVGDAGDVDIIDPVGNAAVIRSGASQYHPIMVARVRAAGTTAGSILALY